MTSPTAVRSPGHRWVPPQQRADDIDDCRAPSFQTTASGFEQSQQMAAFTHARILLLAPEYLLIVASANSKGARTSEARKKVETRPAKSWSSPALMQLAWRSDVIWMNLHGQKL